jgi:hypothetical protein
VSEKIKKQAKNSDKQDRKTSTKAIPTSKSGSSSSPKALRDQIKPRIVSNTEEGGITPFLWALLFIVVVGCGVYAVKPLWAPYVINYLPQLESVAGDQLPKDLLADRIHQLEEEIVLVRKSGQAITDLENERSRMNKNFEGVMTRIITLEKQIDNVRRMKKSTTPLTDALITNESLSRLNSRMIELEESGEISGAILERLNKLEKMVGKSDTSAGGSANGLSQIMTDFSQRIATLESGAAESAAGVANVAKAKQQVRAQTLVLAVSHLRASLRSSDPFVQSLRALKVLGRDDPDIMSGLKDLAPFAQKGIHTMDMLRREYYTVAENIKVAAPKVISNNLAQGTLSEVFNQVTSLVTIRKTDSENYDGFETSLVNTAMDQLDQGDLEGAIVTLSDLDGTEAAAAAPWLKKARGRLIAEKTLSRLHVFVVSILAASIQ